MRRMLPFVIVFLVGAMLMLLVDPLLHIDSAAVTNRVTFVGTIATALATVALAWFAAVQVWDARREQRGVAAALLQEVERIRTELGARPRQGEELFIIDSHTGGVPPERAAIVTDATPPEVHPWFHRVIPRIAESSAAIVGLFLTLDRHLVNYAYRVQRLVAAQGAAKESREALQRWLHDNPNAVAMDTVVVRQNSERDVAMTTANLAAATGEAVTMYRACHDTLDTLAEKLAAVTG